MRDAKSELLLSLSENLQENPLANFIKAIVAGFFIGIGAVFSQTLAAQFINGKSLFASVSFGIGLVMVFHFRGRLYTGEAVKAFFSIIGIEKDKRKYNGVFFGMVVYLFLILAGNFIGSAIISALSANILPAVALQEIHSVVAVKGAHSLTHIALSAIMCNVMVGIAVINNAKTQNQGVSYVITFACVAIFVACGFDHSVANMTYCLTNWIYTGEYISLEIIWTAIFNAVGAFAVAITLSLYDFQLDI